jgi:hypothetical protein
MTRASGHEGEQYEHVGPIMPTSRLFRGVYQFTNEPTVVHLVTRESELTLCGVQRASFVELDPVFEVDEFPICEKCRKTSKLLILVDTVNQELALRRKVHAKANRSH